MDTVIEDIYHWIIALYNRIIAHINWIDTISSVEKGNNSIIACINWFISRNNSTEDQCAH